MAVLAAADFARTVTVTEVMAVAASAPPRDNR
jgi:hypothetical protein